MVEHPAVNGRVAGSSPALGGGCFMFWIYILRHRESGRLYVGSTSDLERRLAEHSVKKPLFKLVYKESRPTQEEAFRREMYLKSGNGRRSIPKLIPVVRK